MACALTTIDNPFDPFEQFTSWFLFDVEKGYNSCAYLARIAKTSDLLSEAENDAEIERAIDDIIANDFQHIYKKVSIPDNHDIEMVENGKITTNFKFRE